MTDATSAAHACQDFYDASASFGHHTEGYLRLVCGLFEELQADPHAPLVVTLGVGAVAQHAQTMLTHVDYHIRHMNQILSQFDMLMANEVDIRVARLLRTRIEVCNDNVQ